MSMPTIREQWNAPNFNRPAVAGFGALTVLITHVLAVWVTLTEPGPSWIFGLFLVFIGWFAVAFAFSCESLGAAVTTTLMERARNGPPPPRG